MNPLENDVRQVGEVGQVGIVVRDLQKAVESYSCLFGIGPWQITTNSAPPLKCVYHEKAASYKVRVAKATVGQITIELIQYVEGDSIHRDFLASGRVGLEHLGIYVRDLEAALITIKKRGIGILQEAERLGTTRDGRYAYLDTETLLGTVLELIQAPSEPSPAEETHP